MSDAGTIGDRLRVIRKARGFTQEELAQAADLSRDLIAKLEANIRVSARVTSLIALANALDCDFSTLVGKREHLGADRDGGSVLALRDAILSPSFLPDVADGHDGEPSPVDVIQNIVDDAWSRYWTGEFGPLLARIPGLIAEARLAHTAYGTAAVQVLAQSYDLSANLLVQLPSAGIKSLARSLDISAQPGQ